MKQLKMYLFCLTVILFFSCSSVSKFMKQGSLESQKFFKEIPFDYSSGLMIIPVEIESKTYYLAFDSGAELNVLDESIAAQIKYKSLRKAKVNSTTSSKRGQIIAEIPKISIDDIEFNNTATVFMDFSGISKILGCTPIHGLIGNNLMRKAHWQIDYQKQVIRVTDDFSKMKIAKDALRLKMNGGTYGNIYFNVNIGETKMKSTFDTGSNSGIQVNKIEVLQDAKHETVEGVLGANVSGVNRGEESYAIIENLQVENIPLQNQRIQVDENANSLLGNKFWEHFVLTFDWKNDELILEPIKEFEENEIGVFELLPLPNYDKGTIEIKRQVKGNKNHTDVPLGTQVLKINEYDVSSFSKKELCDFWDTKWKVIKKQDTIKLLIFQGNEEREVIVKKRKGTKS